MGSSTLIEVTLGTLDGIVSRLMPEQDIQKIRSGLREFEKTFNDYCSDRAKGDYSLSCKDENGCGYSCVFFRRFVERGLPKKLQALERRGGFYTRLGSW